MMDAPPNPPAPPHRVLDVTIPATDGVPLAATLFTPAAAPERLVLVAPATGVRRRLYRPFAEHLAARGLAVLTWDWRGTGDSRPASLRGFAATMRQWGERDLAGVIDWAGARLPDARLLALGHSYGGQSVGLAPNAGRLAALLTVGSQEGWYGHWPWPARWKYAALWHVAVPAATRLAGWFPASLFGLGEDLPAGVALEWARWCRSPGYLGDYRGHRAFTRPLLAFSFDDDPYAPHRAADALHDRYGSVEQVRRRVAPADVGVPRIGHFGFFRAGLVPSLWEEAAGWLARV